MYRTKVSYYSHHYEIVHDLSKYVSSTELSATRTKVAGSNKPEDVGDDSKQSIKELERRTKNLFDWVRNIVPWQQVAIHCPPCSKIRRLSLFLQHITVRCITLRREFFLWMRLASLLWDVAVYWRQHTDIHSTLAGWMPIRKILRPINSGRYQLQCQVDRQDKVSQICLVI